MKTIVVAALLIHGLAGSIQADEKHSISRPAPDQINRGIVTVEAIPTVIVEARRIKNENGVEVAANKNSPRHRRVGEEQKINGEYAFH